MNKKIIMDSHSSAHGCDQAAKKYFHVLLFIILQQGGTYVKEILWEQKFSYRAALAQSKLLISCYEGICRGRNKVHGMINVLIHVKAIEQDYHVVLFISVRLHKVTHEIRSGG